MLPTPAPLAAVPAASTHELPSTEALAFVLAGSAIFTLVSPSGARYTYRVRQPRPGGPHFVQLLTGPDNGRDYQYLGTIFAVKDFVVTKPSSFSRDSLPSCAFAWAWDRLRRGTSLAPVQFFHEGRCAKCARRLTVPTSIASGLGPECRGAA